jgi:type II secretory pathway predicted ATPase ExeA
MANSEDVSKSLSLTSANAPNYYKLDEKPFRVTADTRFLYLAAQHREALASLASGTECNRGGFLARMPSQEWVRLAP